MRHCLSDFWLYILVSLAAPGLQADMLQANPAKDNSVYEDATGNSNGAGKYLFMGRTGDLNGIPASLRRALVAFDVSEIPPNAIIDSVQVSFTINHVPSFGAKSDFAALHRMTRDWGEGGSDAPGNEGRGTIATVGDATWVDAFHNSVSWDDAGGDFATDPSAVTDFGTSDPETITFGSTAGLVADVQAWIRNPVSNFGWALLGDEITVQNARRLASRECEGDATCDGAPPVLQVEFTVPSVIDHLVLTDITAAPSNAAPGKTASHRLRGVAPPSFTNPVSIASAGDGSKRLFIVEQEGIIRIFDPGIGAVLGTAFLDIRDEVFSLEDSGGFDEQGLLGLAFHPDYASNGLFYVNYTTRPASDVWHTVVAEFEVSGNPDVAMSTGTVIMEFNQENPNNNGGDLHFGADGYLYIASGDGGGGGDPFGNGQNVDTLKGALLRIDVDSDPPQNAELCGLVSNYGIPPGNAFPGGNDGCDEILHIGLRNPWRFSFDALTEEMYIADVGQNDWEEVNAIAAGSSGLNFGWPCREGTHAFDPGETCDPPLIEPVIEYGHIDGNCSVIGGYVYRGGRLPLTGHYLYGDGCSERVWVASKVGDSWSSEEWTGAAATLQSLSSFGQGENCELYIADRQAGVVYRIDDSEMLSHNGFESPRCR